MDDLEPMKGIRLIGGRRAQCKDISDDLVLAALRALTRDGYWVTGADLRAALEVVLGPLPVNLFLAKVRKLIVAGKLNGCACGYQGEFQIPEPSSPQVHFEQKYGEAGE